MFIYLLPVTPQPVLLSFNSWRVKHEGDFMKVMSPSIPIGPKALSLKSSSTRQAWAVIMPRVRLISAGGISVFILPVNISFQCARRNSGWHSRAWPMALAASMPTVLPDRVRICMSFSPRILSATSLASSSVFSFKPWRSKDSSCSLSRGARGLKSDILKRSSSAEGVWSLGLAFSTLD